MAKQLNKLAPDVCAKITWKGDKWRCDGWLKPAVRPDYKRESVSEVIDEVLFDSCQVIQDHRWVWCTREEATHVSLYGVCGAIAPIEECKVTGMVEWPQELLDSQRAQALRLIGQMVF